MKTLVLGFLLMAVCSALSPEEIQRLEKMPGHMKPFGSAGPYFDIPVVNEYPSTRDFFNKYVIGSTPLVIKGAVKETIAYRNWTDEYFIQHPKSKELVFAEARKKEVRTEGGFTISFRKYVKHYTKKAMYMVNGVPKFLKPDVPLPNPLKCKEVMAKLADTVMWYSDGGTRSVLHNDDVDNINCLYRGNKTLVFVNRFDTDNEWVNKVIDHPEGSYSGIDVDAVDFVKYPWLADTRYGIAKMEAGDCLFIPYKWHHQVNSFGNNLAINIWFNHLPASYVDLNSERCGDVKDVMLDQCEFETKDAFSGTVPKQVIMFDKNYVPGSELPQAEVKEPQGGGQEPPADEEEGEEQSEGQQPLLFLVQENLSVTPRIDIEDLRAGMKSVIPPSLQAWDDTCQSTLSEIFKKIDTNDDQFITVEDYADQSTLEEKGEEIETLYTQLLFDAKEAQDTANKELIKGLVQRGEISQERAKVFYKFYNDNAETKTGAKEEL
nr:uncharacterized protein LOC100182837 [Ciona intestinalis]|eukprot:XP_009858838.1 uncharacterized protein LOC100182837 [Ciona intestinalis]